MPNDCASTADVTECSLIPLQTMKRKPELGLPRLFDRPKYRQRNIIERLVGWLKQSRKICTRYDKLARRHAAKITLACTLRCFRRYFVQSLGIRAQRIVTPCSSGASLAVGLAARLRVVAQ